MKGTPTPTTEWYHNGVALQPSQHHVISNDQENSETTLEINQITEQDTGAYQMLARNNMGSITSTCIVTIKCKYIYISCQVVILQLGHIIFLWQFSLVDTRC